MYQPLIQYISNRNQADNIIRLRIALEASTEDCRSGSGSNVDHPFLCLMGVAETCLSFQYF